MIVTWRHWLCLSMLMSTWRPWLSIDALLCSLTLLNDFKHANCALECSLALMKCFLVLWNVYSPYWFYTSRKWISFWPKWSAKGVFTFQCSLNNVKLLLLFFLPGRDFACVANLLIPGFSKNEIYAGHRTTFFDLFRLGDVYLFLTIFCPRGKINPLVTASKRSLSIRS